MDVAQLMQDAEDEAWALAQLVKAKRANLGERRKRKDGWWVKGPSGWEREKQPATHAAPAESPSGAHSSVAAWEEAAKGIEDHIRRGGFDGLSTEEMKFHDSTRDAASALVGTMDAATLRRAAAVPGIGAMIRHVVWPPDVRRMARTLGVPFDRGTSHTELARRLNEHLGVTSGTPLGPTSAGRSQTVTALAKLGTPSPRAVKALDTAASVARSIVDGTADKPKRRAPAPPRPLLEEHADHLERMEREARAAGHHGHADRLAAVRAAMRPLDDNKVRAAIRALTEFPGHLINVADVRDRLGDAPRAAVDDALKRLHDARVISLLPNENLKTITDRDRVSAIRLGETDRHLIILSSH